MLEILGGLILGVYLALPAWLPMTMYRTEDGKYMGNNVLKSYCERNGLGISRTPTDKYALKLINTDTGEVIYCTRMEF